MTIKETKVKKIMTEIKSNYPQLSSARLKMIQKYVTMAYEEGYFDSYNEANGYEL